MQFTIRDQRQLRARDLHRPQFGNTAGNPLSGVAHGLLLLMLAAALAGLTCQQGNAFCPAAGNIRERQSGHDTTGVRTETWTPLEVVHVFVRRPHAGSQAVYPVCKRAMTVIRELGYGTRLGLQPQALGGAHAPAHASEQPDRGIVAGSLATRNGIVNGVNSSPEKLTAAHAAVRQCVFSGR